MSIRVWASAGISLRRQEDRQKGNYEAKQAGRTKYTAACKIVRHELNGDQIEDTLIVREMPYFDSPDAGDESPESQPPCHPSMRHR
jgi:hypothetical protein